MKFSRVFDQQAGRFAVVVGLLVASLLPALSPIVAGAAQITSRSIELSSSVADANGVTYEVNFTAISGAGSVVIDFCNDSPLLGADCTPPPGFDVDGATPSAGFTVDATDSSDSMIVLDGTVSVGANTITLTGVNNPTDAGPLYARIVTFTNNTGSSAYTSTTPGTHIDDGGVAISITNNIGVSAAVLETMTFCISGANESDENPLTENCGGDAVAPTLELGEDTGGVIALNSTEVFTGDVYTQLSTNAAGGAIVSLKSSTVGCGGLLRAGADTPSEGCGIAPALETGIAEGEAKFGVKTATAAGVGSNSNGTFAPYDDGGGAYYSNTIFKMNWVSGDATGVTSTYGDPFLYTDGAPVNNMGMTLTFGASAANNTPAGNYSADISLIATGTF